MSIHINHEAVTTYPNLQCQPPVTGLTASLNLSEDGQEATAEPGDAFESRHALVSLVGAEAGPAANVQQPRLTPRKLLRKAVPKRKRMEAIQREAEGVAVQGAGPPSTWQSNSSVYVMKWSCPGTPVLLTRQAVRHVSPAPCGLKSTCRVVVCGHFRWEPKFILRKKASGVQETRWAAMWIS